MASAPHASLMIPYPTTLREIAARSTSQDDFSRHLRDWLQALRRVSSRTQAAAAIADKPEPLREKFPDGHAADAWLAAYAEHLANQTSIHTPAWAHAPERTAPSPIFDPAANSPALLTLALNHSPQAFKQRNIFTPAVDLPLSLRPGRPAKSLDEKRRTNAARQQRFRNTRLAELATLRQAARQQPGPLMTKGAASPLPPAEPHASADDLPSYLK